MTRIFAPAVQNLTAGSLNSDNTRNNKRKIAQLNDTRGEHETRKSICAELEREIRTEVPPAITNGAGVASQNREISRVIIVPYSQDVNKPRNGCSAKLQNYAECATRPFI